jgi:hypothetical protein
MPASYWGLLAKVGPYKLTKTDQKHLHERGSNKHYTSAFTRMRPSSLGSEVLPPGQQDNSNLLPKIFKGMVPDPNFRGVVTGRNPANYAQTTSDRDRAIFNTMENQNYLDKNVSNLNQESRPESFTGPVQRPRVSPLRIEANFNSGGPTYPSPQSPANPSQRRRASPYNIYETEEMMRPRTRRRGNGISVSMQRRTPPGTPSPPPYPSPTPTYISMGQSDFGPTFMRQHQYERGMQQFISAPQYRTHSSNASSRTSSTRSSPTSPIANRTRSRRP